MKYLHISDIEINKQSQQLFNPVPHGECAIGLCYPCCKISYNLTSFLQRPQLLRKRLGAYYKRFEFIIVTLERSESIKSFLNKLSINNEDSTVMGICKAIIQQGKEPYFYILQADLPSPKVLGDILALLHSCILRLEKVGAMVFFETNVLGSPLIGKILQENNKFLQNIIYFPVYSRIEQSIFLLNMAKDWGISPPQKLMLEMIGSFGGSLWLLREALRCYKDYGMDQIDVISTSPGIKLRINALLDKLSPEEKKSLILLQEGYVDKTSPEIRNHLLRVGLIEVDNKKWSITIPILLPHLKMFSTAQLLHISKGHIMFQYKNVSESFTIQEKRVLTLLLNRKGTIVSRELIARALWKAEWEDRYSDWAIDKVVSRLRATMRTIGISSIIQTKKGLGFIIK